MLTGSLKIDDASPIDHWKFADWSTAARVNAKLDASFRTGSAGLLNTKKMRNKAVLLECDDESFLVKARHAEEAGAVCVIFVNTDQTNPDAVAAPGDDSGRTVGIPVLMISLNDGRHLTSGMTVRFLGSCLLTLDA